jgi:hypothetical protein
MMGTKTQDFPNQVAEANKKEPWFIEDSKVL